MFWHNNHFGNRHLGQTHICETYVLANYSFRLKRFCPNTYLGYKHFGQRNIENLTHFGHKHFKINGHKYFGWFLMAEISKSKQHEGGNVCGWKVPYGRNVPSKNVPSGWKVLVPNECLSEMSVSKMCVWPKRYLKSGWQQFVIGVYASNSYPWLNFEIFISHYTGRVLCSGTAKQRLLWGCFWDYFEMLKSSHILK